jgi:hypothetical protein
MKRIPSWLGRIVAFAIWVMAVTWPEPLHPMIGVGLEDTVGDHP